jgi:hypothetical protein
MFKRCPRDYKMMLHFGHNQNTLQKIQLRTPHVPFLVHRRVLLPLSYKELLKTIANYSSLEQNNRTIISFAHSNVHLCHLL